MLVQEAADNKIECVNGIQHHIALWSLQRSSNNQKKDRKWKACKQTRKKEKRKEEKNVYKKKKQNERTKTSRRKAQKITIQKQDVLDIQPIENQRVVLVLIALCGGVTSCPQELT